MSSTSVGDYEISESKGGLGPKIKKNIAFTVGPLYPRKKAYNQHLSRAKSTKTHIPATRPNHRAHQPKAVANGPWAGTGDPAVRPNRLRRRSHPFLASSFPA